MTRLLLDTSVVVPRLVPAHPHHAEASAQFNRAERGDAVLFLATHVPSDARDGGVLRRPDRAHDQFPAHAGRGPVAIQKALGQFEGIVTLDADDYALVLARIAALSLVSGAVYDGLHVRAAEKAGADELVTFNGRDFRRMPPAPPTRLVVLGPG